MASRRDVAEAAGVSMRTVSNVVNGFIHVAPSTRQRVLEAIAALDYRPSELARSLKAGRSGLIALVLPELDTPYFAELTRAFVEDGARRGVTVVIDQTDGDLERERYLIDRTEYGSLFDGLVISPLGLRPSHVEHISPDRPLVFLGEDPFPRFDHVMIDNRCAAVEAVMHLIGGGRRRIAAVGAQRHPHGASSQRLEGYLHALREARLEVDDSLIVYVETFRREHGWEAAHRLLERVDPPDAIFAFSDPLALGALRALNQRGVRVPDDIAIVGFDDIEDGRFSTPSLTTVSPDRRAIARAALDRIEAKLAGSTEPAQLTIAPHSLEIRESAPARIA